MTLTYITHTKANLRFVNETKGSKTTGSTYTMYAYWGDQTYFSGSLLTSFYSQLRRVSLSPYFLSNCWDCKSLEKYYSQFCILPFARPCLFHKYIRSLFLTWVNSKSKFWLLNERSHCKELKGRLFFYFILLFWNGNIKPILSSFPIYNPCWSPMCPHA